MVIRILSILLYLLVLAWLAAGIWSIDTNPQQYWPIGFVAFSTPGALLLNLLFLLFWALRRSWLALVPLVVVVVGWEYYHRGFALNLWREPVPAGAASFQVLSFNATVFNNYLHLRDPDMRSSTEMIDWLARHPADIVLVQEYYNKNDSEVFNTSERIQGLQERELALSLAWKNKEGEQFGLAIFSKFPIVNRDQLPFPQLSFHHGMFADLKIDQDTIRVYNVHLQSMSIDSEAIAGTLRGQQVRTQWRDAGYRFRKGFFRRSVQVDSLLAHISQSPYPVIIGGDFNDTPWTYTYEQFSKHLSNAFEGAGRGFGFTFNGKIPFLRIDHQFYGPRLRVHDYQVHREMPHSDHFPHSAVYSLTDE